MPPKPNKRKSSSPTNPKRPKLLLTEVSNSQSDENKLSEERDEYVELHQELAKERNENKKLKYQLELLNNRIHELETKNEKLATENRDLKKQKLARRSKPLPPPSGSPLHSGQQLSSPNVTQNSSARTNKLIKS